MVAQCSFHAAEHALEHQPDLPAVLSPADAMPPDSWLTAGDREVADWADLLVIAPDTDPAVAERALRLAGASDDLLRPEDILERATS